MEDSSERDEWVMSVVAGALQCPATEREGYLRNTCGNDSQLYQEVAETIEWEARMGSFLLHPMIAFKHFARAFQVGQVISERFELIREIGEGGMGVVYEAFDRKRNQRIAIKCAKPGFQRLLSPELEGALRVRHPNVCLVNEIHTAQTEYGEIDFLTMELLEGETLSARLSSRGSLGSDEALEIVRQLCAGLAEAHRKGVIHRDLKSDNVILCRPLDKDLRVVITDFGLAVDIAETAEAAGTPRYMAPELWEGEKASVASDIYGLGVILYEIVAGRLSSDENVRDGVKNLTASANWNKALHARWVSVTSRCLNASPAARPIDASRVLADLEGKPIRKAPLLALALLVFVMLLLSPVREWLRDFARPANVRLAVLPLNGPPDAAPLGSGVLQDTADRLRHLPTGDRTMIVIPPSESIRMRIETPQQARQILHATHAMQVTIRREGAQFVAQGSVVDLETETHVRDFSGRYSAATFGTLPSALVGYVSLAFNLSHEEPKDTLSPAAAVPYGRGLYILQSSGANVDDAITSFEVAARLDPRSPLPLARLAEAEIRKFNTMKDADYLAKARQHIQLAESLNPDSARVRIAAGLLNETTSRYESALEDYRRVQELEPRNVDAFLRVASIYDKLDRPEKAIEAYRKAIAIDPSYYESYEDLGEFYYYRGRYPEAAEQFKKTIDRAPGMYDAYTNLAAALDNMGMDAEAEQALLKSLELRETARALNSMGAVRAFQKRDAEAIGFYTRAVKLNPRVYVYLLNLGDSNRRLGRLQEAQTAYGQAMDLALAELQENPRRGYTRAFVGYFAARLGDHKRAEDEIGQSLQLSPTDNEVVRCAVLTYEALGRRDGAISALRQATAGLLRELDRHPDLADFRDDTRFKQLLANTASGGK